MKRFVALGVSVLVVTAVSAGLTYLAMLITAAGRTEYVDYTTMTAYAGWLAFCMLLVIMVPVTFGVERSFRPQRWIYTAAGCAVATVWTFLLDGPIQLLSYILGPVIGACAGITWATLIKALNPMGEHIG